jgi:hypothetical protein
MLCPNCKKHETSVVNSNYNKFLNTIKRDRYCACGHKFITYEINQSEFKSQTLKIQKTFKKVNKVKRKSREDTIWKNIRFYWYGEFRVIAAIRAMSENFNKKILGKEFEGHKKGGKIYWRINEPGMKKAVIYKTEKKKETINSMLKLKFYWVLRNSCLKDKPITDMENKDKVRAEAQQFYKSVCQYIKNDEYNKEFFSTFSKALHSAKILKTEDMMKMWMDDNHWKIWLLVR